MIPSYLTILVCTKSAYFFVVVLLLMVFNVFFSINLNFGFKTTCSLRIERVKLNVFIVQITDLSVHENSNVISSLYINETKIKM